MNKRQDIERIAKYYPTIHLWGKWYLVRKYSRKARKISLWHLVCEAPKGDNNG